MWQDASAHSVDDGVPEKDISYHRRFEPVCRGKRPNALLTKLILEVYEFGISDLEMLLLAATRL